MADTSTASSTSTITTLVSPLYSYYYNYYYYFYHYYYNYCTSAITLLLFHYFVSVYASDLFPVCISFLFSSSSPEFISNIAAMQSEDQCACVARFRMQLGLHVEPCNIQE